MADVTSNGTGGGDWNLGATWVGGAVPVDGQSVLIAGGDTVTFNVNQSAWVTGINGLTITGTLKVSATTSSYMFIKAGTTIDGTGTFNVGTQAVPIPFAVKFTLTGGNGWGIIGSNGLDITVYAAEPAIKYVRLTAVEPAGETVLAVDTDVTGDIWSVGDEVHVDRAKEGYGSEKRVIAPGGIAAGSITITVGLTAEKPVGAYVVLLSRNVKFIGLGADLITCWGNDSAVIDIAGGQWTAPSKMIIYYSKGTVVSGGVFYDATLLTTYSENMSISGGVFSGLFYITNAVSGIIASGGLFVDCAECFYVTAGLTIAGGSYMGNSRVVSWSNNVFITGGVFSNNYIVFSNGYVVVYNATFSYNEQAFQNSYVALNGVTFANNTVADLFSCSFTAFNTLLGSAVENGGYLGFPVNFYSSSIHHDQVLGAFRSWTKGGITTGQAVVVPPGGTSAKQTVLASATSQGFWQQEFTVGPGTSINVVMWLRKDGSMAYLPRCVIFNKAETDPFGGGAGIHTFTMTDSVDTWETETYTYYNGTANDVTLIIRCQGMAASGNLFSVATVEQINVDLTTALANIATIDTIVDAIKLKTDNLPTDPADESLLEAAIGAIPVAPSVDSILDEPVEGAYTMRQALRVILAAIAGKATGGGTATITFRDVNDTTNRIVATVDSNGNRSTVILNVA